MGAVTVEEASHRLGVSVATVRRRLSRGTLVGVKVGRDWHVDDGSLPPINAARRGASAAEFTTDELDLAIQHVSRVDLSELWVPDILRWADMLGERAGLIAQAKARVGAGISGTAVEVRIPKTALASRAGAMLDLPDRIIYQAAVARLAIQVDAITSESVFSSRTTSDRRYFLERSVDQYVKWRKATLTRLKATSGMLVSTDLSSYFDLIDQPTLLKELDELTGETYAIEVVRRQLKSWSVLLHRGIPQGPNASRLMGNAYLIPVDDYMVSKGYDYRRYMDDVTIVVADRAEAARAVGDFERACHRRGLIIGSAKTKVQTVAEAVADSGNAAKDNVEYLTKAGSARARVALMKIFYKAVPREGGIDISDTKFSVWRLAKALDRGPLNRILLRIADLGPVASVGAAYLRHFLANPKAAKAVGDFLSDPERNTSPFLESWFFAAILEHPTRTPEAWSHRARAVAFDRNAASYHRVLAMNVLALDAKASDLAQIRRVIVQEHDPEIVRGAVVALARVGKLDTASTASVRARHPDLEVALRYLKGRRDLPSLVYRGRTVQVRT